MAKRERSTQAKAAAMIRKHLKTEYPHTTFKVTSRGFAGGDSVDIRWTDGPTTKEVQAFTGQFQYGNFDGMQDLYEYTNTRDDIPQSKYVHCQQGHSAAAYRDMVSILNELRNWNLQVDENAGYNTIVDGDHHTGNGWASQEIYRSLITYSLICTECKAGTLPADKFCPQCGAPTPVTCHLCEQPTPARDTAEMYGHRYCTSCYLTEVEYSAIR